MGVLYVNPMIKVDARDSSPIDKNVVTRGLTDYYQVGVDAGTTADEVLISPQVPKPKSPHPSGSLFRATNRQANRVSPILYEVAIEYETPQLSLPTQDGGDPTNPLAMPPEIEFDAEDVVEEIDREANDSSGNPGKPIIMVTGEEFEPRMTEVQPSSVVRITKNVLTVNPFVMQQFRNSTNTDPWYDLPAGTAWMRRLRAKNVTSPDWQYWQLMAEVYFRLGADNGGTTNDKAWYRRVRAQGWKVAYKLFGIVKYGPGMESGQRATRPVLHRIYKNDGSPADPNGGPGELLGEQIKDNTKAQWYYWRTKKQNAFAELKLLENINV